MYMDIHYLSVESWEQEQHFVVLDAVDCLLVSAHTPPVVDSSSGMEQQYNRTVC